MIPTGFPECTTVLQPAPGTEDKVSNLPIHRAPGMFTGSVWELSPEELEAVAKTGKIAIGVCSGGISQPPIFAGVYVPGFFAEVQKQF